MQCPIVKPLSILTYISGDSAGGNLAAALALYLRDTMFKPKPRLQILLSPCLQAIDFNSPAYSKYKYDTFLSARVMAGYWLLYARGSINKRILDVMVTNNHTSAKIKKEMYSTYTDSRKVKSYSHLSYTPNKEDFGDYEIWSEIRDTFLDPYFAPLMANDLRGLPATYMMTVEQDVLRDDGIWYAQRLEEAGNDVTHVHHAHALHGMVAYLKVLKGGNDLVQQMLTFVKDKL